MLLRAGLVEGRLDAGVLSSGQVAGVIDDLPSVAELIARIMSEAEQTLKRSGRADVSKTTGSGRRELVHDRRGRARAARRARRRDRFVLLADRARGVGQPERARARTREPGRAVAHRDSCGRGRRTTTRRPSRTSSPDPFVPYTVCAVELGAEQMVVLGAARDRRRPRRSSRSAWRWSSCSARSTKTTSTSTSSGSGRPLREGARSDAVSEHDIAILGAGMHPWGKWGRNFVEYGVVAAQAALADAGVAWPDIQFVSGADTMRNGYPGYVAGATFAQALGWNGAQVASSYAACASGVDRARDGARPDPRRVLRRRARHRRRHHAEGLPRAEQGRARRRSRLAALPAARRDQPDVLRAVRPPAHGAVRRDPRRLRPGEGEERAARAREPERALPQGSVDRRRAHRADRLRSARPARHLRDERRRGRARRVVSLEYARRARRRRPGARARDLDGHAELPADHDRAPELRDRQRGRHRARCPSTASRSRSRCARTRRPASAPTTSTAPRSTTSRPRWSSTGTSRSACARRARPRSCCATARPRSAAASR